MDKDDLDGFIFPDEAPDAAPETGPSGAEQPGSERAERERSERAERERAERDGADEPPAPGGRPATGSPPAPAPDATGEAGGTDRTPGAPA